MADIKTEMQITADEKTNSYERQDEDRHVQLKHLIVKNTKMSIIIRCEDQDGEDMRITAMYKCMLSYECLEKYRN